MKTWTWDPIGKLVTVMNGSRKTNLGHALRYSSHFDCGPEASQKDIYELACSILINWRNHTKPMSYVASFSDRFLRDKNPDRPWSITSDELSVWYAIECERLNAKKAVA